MKRLQTSRMEGLVELELTKWKDSRGFFVELMNEKTLSSLEIPAKFAQLNLSQSQPGVVRGLHYQSSPAQSKLLGVVRGAIFDVVVDLRKDSKTFGEWQSFEISETNNRMIWIPSGFAHGFCAIGNVEAQVIYLVDCLYNPKTEGGLRFDDPDLNIPWPVTNPIVSEKDLALSSLKAFRSQPVAFE